MRNHWSGEVFGKELERLSESKEREKLTPQFLILVLVASTLNQALFIVEA